MGEIRYIIIAKQCEVAGKSLILDGCLKKGFFGHPSRIDDFPCNLTQFCYSAWSLYFRLGLVWEEVLENTNSNKVILTSSYKQYTNLHLHRINVIKFMQKRSRLPSNCNIA